MTRKCKFCARLLGAQAVIDHYRDCPALAAALPTKAEERVQARQARARGSRANADQMIGNKRSVKYVTPRKDSQ